MQGRVTVLAVISLLFLQNKCVKFNANRLRDNRVIDMLHFWVNAIWDADADANANADAGVRTIALHILRIVELKIEILENPV